MPMIPLIFSGKWPRKFAGLVLAALSPIVFLSLDFLDTFLCISYRIVDGFLEGDTSPCYCRPKGVEGEMEVRDERDNEVSETLYGRKNVFREMCLFGFLRKKGGLKKSGGGTVGNRWSDCGCESCLSWMRNGDQRLHVVVREPSPATFGDDCSGKQMENVIFLHGFLSSSLFWTETVLPNLSESTKSNYRLFAVDLLGFGRSPKPRDCLYTLKDHLDLIEKSVIYPFQLDSFHLVAHSMGCVIATALAAKYSKFVQSITLIAPPYFPCNKDGASFMALGRLADRKLWPPLLFGSAVMSWYEHVGRCVCFLVCRYHRTWEWILKLLTRRRDLHFMLFDLTRHTHHSAWHTMHNVICGGAKLMDVYLEILKDSGVNIHVFQGSSDNVVPVECSSNIKMKIPNAEVNVIADTGHSTVILGREKVIAQDLEHIWEIASNKDDCSRYCGECYCES